jgi:hypothetical protein
MDAGLWTRTFGHQWLAGESQTARGHLKEVGSERQFCPSNGCPDPSPFNLYPVWPGSALVSVIDGADHKQCH